MASNGPSSGPPVQAKPTPTAVTATIAATAQTASHQPGTRSAASPACPRTDRDITRPDPCPERQPAPDGTSPGPAGTGPAGVSRLLATLTAWPAPRWPTLPQP